MSTWPLRISGTLYSKVRRTVSPEFELTANCKYCAVWAYTYCNARLGKQKGDLRKEEKAHQKHDTLHSKASQLGLR